MNSLLRRLSSDVSRKLKKAPLLRDWYTNRQFRVERALLKGQSPAVSSRPSVLHFSMNKAATQYTKRIMIRCGQENDLVPVRMSDYAWVKEFPYLFTLSAEDVKQYLHIFRPHGYLYSVFGGLVEGIPNIEAYRTVLMIRDPRDALVSGYHSYSKSHAVPQAKDKADEFLAFRERISNQSLDDYVMDVSANAKWRMQQYLDLKRSHPGVCVMKYEDMIADFEPWLDAILNYCGWQISAELRDSLVAEAKKSRSKKDEDVTKHRRQVTPGEHKRKLQSSTVQYLDECFADILQGFGYK